MVIDDDVYRGLTAIQIADLVTSRRVSARAVVDACLRRLEHVDHQLRAFRGVWPQSARQAADAVDRSVAKGEKFPLAGVPIGVKAWGGLAAPQARRLLAAGCIAVERPRFRGLGTGGRRGATPTGALRLTPGDQTAFPAGHRPVRPWPWPLASSPWRPAATVPGRPASPPRGAALSASSRRTPADQARMPPASAWVALARSVPDAAAYLDAVLGGDLAGRRRPRRSRPGPRGRPLLVLRRPTPTSRPSRAARPSGWRAPAS